MGIFKDMIVLVLQMNAEDDAVEETAFPDRSPLHEAALNHADLKKGVVIQPCNIHGHIIHTEGIVLDEPFVHRNQTYGYDSWKVRVATQNRSGEWTIQDWFLSDMGIVPYERPDGTPIRWNGQNYTVAVTVR